MESPEELLGSLTDPSHIIKGKRTKRPRLDSHILAPSSSSHSAGDNHIDAATKPPVKFAGSVTEEEEDLANSLILLAQGHPRNFIQEGFKFMSHKRFLENPNSQSSGKMQGIYAYQCKTCNKTFPSFQALGGHRASHSKPRPPSTVAVPFDGVEEERPDSKTCNISPPMFSLQLSTKSTSSSKIHECAICGAEFASGQALGGHMRRHRALAVGDEAEEAQEEAKKQRVSVSLDLDLNLPAAAESEDCQPRNFELAFSAERRQQPTSATPALVGCHY
ncbi:hypothetical protein NMG60_11018686 [Bertholletia excelsa]